MILPRSLLGKSSFQFVNEEDRATGFLIPTYGTSTVRGQTISNAFFWAINRSQDATFAHDWFSKTGQGYGAEYRFIANPTSDDESMWLVGTSEVSVTALRGGEILPVAAPKTDFADAAAAVRLALEHEREVTNQIASLAQLAREENDLVGEQFLHWFLEEQREEVSSMAALLATVQRADGNMLLVEDYLARRGVGGGEPASTAPPAAGGAL